MSRSSLSVSLPSLSFLFFFNDTATTEIYTLSLHDALPICTSHRLEHSRRLCRLRELRHRGVLRHRRQRTPRCRDRKSTRLNSSHSQISYAVFCLKKKKKLNKENTIINDTIPQRLYIAIITL